MKKKICICLTAIMLAGSLGACNIGDTEIVLDTKMVSSDTVFSVNEIDCDITEVKLYFCTYKNLYGTEYNLDLWNYDFEGASIQKYVKDVTLDELTRIKCMSILAGEQSITLTKSDKKKISKMTGEFYDSLTEDEIEYMDISKSDVREIYTDYALAEKLYRSLTENINTEVSDDDARVIKIQQIFVKDEKNAKTVAKKLKNGSGFEYIAKSYNEADEIECNVSRGELPAEVEAVAFDLDNDAVSDKIVTPEGFYFIKCINKFDEDLTQANKANILVQREKEQFNNIYESFVENAEFELNSEIWNEIKIDDGSKITTNCFFELYDKYFK